ncbi:MAG: pyrrolysine--tRNA(Pyl) ligase large subunit [Oscillospiraceae bacterium]
MAVDFTQTQLTRLSELGLPAAETVQRFPDNAARDDTYRKLVQAASAGSRRKISGLLTETHTPSLCALTQTLAQALCADGFTQVTTPTIIPKSALDKMSVDNSHPLRDQVFWVDKNSCLRPMLAPNLYDLSRSLLRLTKGPLRVFEIGSCFRKESEGKLHLKEFTMLNLVEWNIPLDERLPRLKRMLKLVLDAAGIDDYRLIEENSVVYGAGLDVVTPDDTELASTSMGPHPLDDAWKITCSWVGAGFGLERLLMHKHQAPTIRHYAKSLTFLDGCALNI